MSTAPSRRQLLKAALLTPAAAACTTGGARPRAFSPDVALRAAAVARERALVAMYDALSPSARLQAVRAEHVEHLAVLLGAGPSAAPSSSTSPAPSLPQLVAAERAAAAEHAAAALAASRSLAAVLASLAASEASHPVALA